MGNCITRSQLRLPSRENLFRCLPADNHLHGPKRLCKVAEDNVFDALAGAVHREVVLAVVCLLDEEDVGVPRGGHVWRARGMWIELCRWVARGRR